MLTLKYQSETTDVKAVKERLEELSLAFQTISTQENDLIVLADSQKEYIGKASILKYLEELQEELKKWYYCNC